MKGKFVHKKKEAILTLAIMTTVLAGAGGYVWYTHYKNATESHVPSAAERSLSTPATASPYTDLYGNPVRLTDFIGKVLVVNSWASWCPDCVTELKILNELTKDFSDGTVQIIAINRAEPAHVAQSFLQSFGISEDVMLVLDPDDRYYFAVDAFSMPETIVYTPNGEVFRHKRSAYKKSDLKATIIEARKQLPPEV